MLEVIDIKKTYDGVPVLDGVSFAVRPAEIVCLLGPSGSGKSTLLRILAGLEPPDAGRVLWDGSDLASMPAHLRDFGLVFQDYALFPHLDVLSNVAFGLRMRRWPEREIRARVKEVLDLVNLRGFESRSVTELSGGEQQRVAVARALAPRPRLLMFDEPLGALDRSLKEDLLGELRAILRTTGVPALYVTHDQDEAFAIGDTVLILEQGRIVRGGPPPDVLADPGSAAVARFLGLGNVLEGEIVARKGRKWTVRTSLGSFDVDCGASARIGQKASILIRPERVKPAASRGAIASRVREVIFQKNGYRVTLENGLVLKLDQAPKAREKLAVRVEAVECLE